MTLRADLAALLDDAGIVDVDIDEAVADEHVRVAAYLKVVAVAAAEPRRDGDHALLARLLRDPESLASKTAVVELVDRVAMTYDDPAGFRRWTAGVLPEIDRLMPDGHRDFVHWRIHDWTVHLTVMTGRIPAPAEITQATNWMQRRLAAGSTSLPVLTILTESGRTRKIRNIARNRAAARAVRK